MATYGYRPSAAAQGVAYGDDNSNNYLAYVPDAMTENGWAYSMGVAIGPRVGGDPITVLMNIHDPGDNPVGVRQSTATFVASSPVVVDASNTASAKYTANLPSEVQLRSGSKYPLSVHAINGLFAVGMIEANAYPGKDNYLLYWKSDSTHPSADPMNPASSRYEGHLAIWINYETNVPPDEPTILSPATGATVSSLFPTLSGNFSDDNESLPGGISADELDQFQLEVRRVSDNHLMWTIQDDSTSAERIARAFSRVYDGEALVSGIQYKWRCRVFDRFGSASAYSDYQTFTPGSSSVSVSAGTPTGKQETQTPGPFTGVWTHTGGLSTNAVRVRIRNRVTGATVRQIGSTGTGTVAKTVAPGGTISVTWAELVTAATATYWANLPWGGDYVYEIQGRDTANVWSGWSTPTRAFTVNAAPAVPTNLQPNYTVPPQTSRPLLTATVTDNDDTSATGLLVKAGIVGPFAVTNGAFPSAITGWTVGTLAGITRTGSFDAVVGALAAGSLKVQITANTAGIGAKLKVTNDDQYPCVVGQSYTARASLRTDNVSITPRMIIEWYTSGNALIGAASEEADWTPTVGTFSARTITATAPATAAYFKIGFELFCDTANPLGSAWIDDATVDDGVRYLRNMTYDATLKNWKYQTVSQDIPSFAAYSFWAYAFDGTVYSGGTTVETSASKSATASFVYATGPSVTVTYPTEGLALDTDTPTATWTNTGTQAGYRVILQEWNAITLAWEERLDTGVIASSVQSYTFNPGLMFDGFSYRLLIQVTDTLAAVGSSPWVNFSLDYVEPPVIPGFLASPMYAANDVEPSAVRLVWDQASVPSGDFLWYRVNREPADDTPYSLEEMDQESRRARIGIIPNVTETAFVDWTAPANVVLRYRIRQYVQSGSSWISSQIETAQIQLDFEQAILQEFNSYGAQPEHRVVMEFRGERRIDRNRDVTLFHRMGKRKPLAIKGPGYWRGISARFRLWGENPGDVDSQLRELEFLDASTLPLLYRDGRGKYIFCTMEGFSEVDPSGGKIREVDLTLTQIDVPEIFE
jgi:hypothetical protein